MNQQNQAITFIKRSMASITMLVTLMSTGAMAQSREASARARSPGSQSKLKSDVAAAKTELVKAAAEYKSSLAKVVSMYEAVLKNAQQQFEARKQLFAEGIILKKDLDDSEKQIAEAQAKIDEARKQTAEADDLIAESSVVEDDEPARAAGRTPSLAGRYTAPPALIRYTGTAHWALADAAKVGSFFLSRFGHQMPISAYGQTATHDRLGFDHRNAVDVAVHPDSAEGQALTAYLKSQGIPFIAFRHAVSGSATGAHIHIGYPSRRVGGSESSMVRIFDDGKLVAGINSALWLMDHNNVQLSAPYEIARSHVVPPDGRPEARAGVRPPQPHFDYCGYLRAQRPGRIGVHRNGRRQHYLG